MVVEFIEILIRIKFKEIENIFNYCHEKELKGQRN